MNTRPSESPPALRESCWGIEIDPMPGSHFSEVADQAYHLSIEKRMAVRFKFNDVRVVISPEPRRPFIAEDWWK